LPETIAFTTGPMAKGREGSLGVGFAFANKPHFFAWQGDLATGKALFEADFGSGRTQLSAAVSLLKPEYALAEAMFF
jgi:hypothetical protein